MGDDLMAFYLFIFVILLILLPVSLKIFFRSKIELKKILREHNLSISELTTGLNCTYVGGYPGCNKEAKHVVVGAKDGYLKFFKGVLLYYNDGLSSSRGTLNWVENPAHLFDIPINEDTEVSDCFDDRSKITVTYGIVPITWKIGDIIIFIKWFNGNRSYIAEFHINGLDSKNRAYMLRDTLDRMINENR